MHNFDFRVKASYLHNEMSLYVFANSHARDIKKKRKEISLQNS